MRIFIISYKRPSKVRTSRWLKSAEIVVPESQKADYETYNENPILAIPDEEDGNISKKRNAILKRFEGEDIVILDDDVGHVGYHEEGIMYQAREDQFIRFCEQMFLMAHDLGIGLWGVNVQTDKKFYREYSPFSLTSVVLAPFCGIINTDGIRYDEEIFLKEDYDFFIQKIYKHRKVLRYNKWYYMSDHIKNEGGLSGHRSMVLEREHAKKLQQKWGDSIVKIRRNSINPVVKIPIGGI